MIDAAFDIGGAEDVARGLEAHVQAVGAIRARLGHGQPLAIGHGHGPLAHDLEHAIDQARIAREAHPQGILQDERQERGGRRRADDRSVEAGSQQIRDPADVVDVAVGDEERPDPTDIEIDLQPPRRGPVTRNLGALEQAAVDQDRAALVELELVARAGDALDGTVVDDGRKAGHRT